MCRKMRDLVTDVSDDYAACSDSISSDLRVRGFCGCLVQHKMSSLV